MADNPGLSSILARLAQYNQPSPNALASLSRNESGVSASPGQQSASISNSEARRQIPTPRTRPNIDPATITTWQEGLRCVTKIAARDRSFEASIRKMMHEQRAQEVRWYAERQELMRVQATRSKSSADAMSILQSLNPSGTSVATETNGEASTIAELAKLDRRIYDAQLASHERASMILKSLGVPFFGTLHTLISDDADNLPVNDLPKYSQPVNLQQIKDLQRRMIAHLEDLYRD